MILNVANLTSRRDLLRHREQAEQSEILKRLALEPKGYAALTLHPPAGALWRFC